MSLVKNEKDLKMNDWIPEVERIKMFEKGEGYCAFSFGLKTLRLIRKDFPIRAGPYNQKLEYQNSTTRTWCLYA